MSKKARSPISRTRVAIYVNSASKRQRDAEVRKLRKCARRQGWTVGRVFTDAAGSTKALSALIDAVQCERVRAVLVHRFSGPPEVSLSLATKLLRMADAGEANVYSVLDGVDLAGRLGRWRYLTALYVAARNLEERIVRQDLQLETLRASGPRASLTPKTKPAGRPVPSCGKSRARGATAASVGER